MAFAVCLYVIWGNCRYTASSISKKKKHYLWVSTPYPSLSYFYPSPSLSFSFSFSLCCISLIFSCIYFSFNFLLTLGMLANAVLCTDVAEQFSTRSSGGSRLRCSLPNLSHARTSRRCIVLGSAPMNLIWSCAQHATTRVCSVLGRCINASSVNPLTR